MHIKKQLLSCIPNFKRFWPRIADDFHSITDFVWCNNLLQKWCLSLSINGWCCVVSYPVKACSTIIYDCKPSCNVLTASLIFQDFFSDVNVISWRSGFQWNNSNNATSVSLATTLTSQCSAKSIAHLTIFVSASSLQFPTVCLSAIKILKASL